MKKHVIRSSSQGLLGQWRSFIADHHHLLLNKTDLLLVFGVQTRRPSYIGQLVLLSNLVCVDKVQHVFFVLLLTI